MNVHTPKKGTVLRRLYRFIDFKQPEVKWACPITLLFELFIAVITVRSNFKIYESEICNILQTMIGGIIGMIGIAIAGVAIVVTLFSSEQITMIENMQEGTYGELLFDFQWYGLISALDVVLLVIIVFLIKSPMNIAPIGVFYLISFLVIYLIIYLLFYGYALIGNCIKMYRIKNTLDSISKTNRAIQVKALDLEIDYLISKLLHNNKNSAKEFYIELIKIIKNSDIEDKDKIIDYFNKKTSVL